MVTDQPAYHLDHLDLALLEALATHPRAGDLELSRVVRVARATVQARLRRMEEAGVVTGWGPRLDLAAAGYPVKAVVSLEIAQGRLDAVGEELAALPQVTEAYVTTGTADIVCTVAAASHQDLQAVLLQLHTAASVVRSTSVVVLTTLVAPRTLPLLAAGAEERAAAGERTPRAPAYR